MYLSTGQSTDFRCVKNFVVYICSVCTRENLNYCLTSSFPEIILGPSVVDTRYHAELSLEGVGAEWVFAPLYGITQI